MAKVLKDGEPYAGRAAGVHPVSLSLNQDAWALLRRYAPTTKSHGHFVSRLLYEFAAKRDVVARITASLAEEDSPDAAARH